MQVTLRPVHAYIKKISVYVFQTSPPWGRGVYYYFRNNGAQIRKWGHQKEGKIGSK